MTAPVLKPEFLDHLTRPGPRLSGLSSWLLTDIWSEAAFQAAERSPQAYLLNGERWVNALETLMVAAGDQLYAELADPPSGQFETGRFLNENRDAAVVVFDGCSLREIPRLRQLAHDSGREVRTLTCGRAALPSDTEAFVGGRLGFRKIPAHVLANLTAINFNAKAHPIPIDHLTKEQRKGLDTANMSQSLSVRSWC